MNPSNDSLAAVVLGAGSGTRLRPLTDLRPKALCPVANVTLVDHAISAVETSTTAVAVNAWHKREQMQGHLDGRVQVSVEDPDPLGTAGALGNLKGWIDERAVLVHNADAWHRADIESFVSGWNEESVRLLVTRDTERADFDDWRFCGVSMLPWTKVRDFPATPAGLWELCWRDLWANDELDLVEYVGPFFDCGTPEDYLSANLTAAGEDVVIGADAIVKGTVEHSVVWPGAYVGDDEHLVSVIRADDGVTVQC